MSAAVLELVAVFVAGYADVGLGGTVFIVIVVFLAFITGWKTVARMFEEKGATVIGGKDRYE